MTLPHSSVLVKEITTFFQGCKIDCFVDATFGAGGHSEAILRAHPEIKTLIGIDQDPLALSIGRERLKDWEDKLFLIASNFEHFQQHLSSAGVKKVEGILFDLGVSSMQFDQAERGFSFMREGPLDMRMNPKETLTAQEIVNTWSEKDLGSIFRDYGEEKKWRILAKAIVRERASKPILTTSELVNLLMPYFPIKKKKIHPLTLVFQALRISVNHELEALETALPQAIEALSSGGRLAVISFHSLEDRIVKNLLRFAASDKYDTSGIEGVFLDKEPTIKLLTRKPISPTEQEIAENPRSRSAKLRVIEKL